MDKHIEEPKNNETEGSFVNRQSKEELEISSTGYGYESVPLQSKQGKNPKM
jgi:hypothetical protein